MGQSLYICSFIPPFSRTSMKDAVDLLDDDKYSEYLQVGCCGVSGPGDWAATSWGRGHTARLPHSCCLTTSQGESLTSYAQASGLCYSVKSNVIPATLSLRRVNCCCFLA